MHKQHSVHHRNSASDKQVHGVWQRIINVPAADIRKRTPILSCSAIVRFWVLRSPEGNSTVAPES